MPNVNIRFSDDEAARLRQYAADTGATIRAAIIDLLPGPAMLKLWQALARNRETYGDFTRDATATKLGREMQDCGIALRYIPYAKGPEAMAEAYLRFADAIARRDGGHGPLGSVYRLEEVPAGGHLERGGVTGLAVLAPGYRITPHGIEPAIGPASEASGEGADDE